MKQGSFRHDFMIYSQKPTGFKFVMKLYYLFFFKNILHDVIRCFVCGIKKKLAYILYLKITTALTIHEFDWILYEWMEMFVAALFLIVRIVFIIIFCLKLPVSVFYIPLATTRTNVFRWHNMEKLYWIDLYVNF